MRSAPGWFGQSSQGLDLQGLGQQRSKSRLKACSVEVSVRAILMAVRDFLGGDELHAIRVQCKAQGLAR